MQPWCWQRSGSSNEREGEGQRALCWDAAAWGKLGMCPWAVGGVRCSGGRSLPASGPGHQGLICLHSSTRSEMILDASPDRDINAGFKTQGLTNPGDFPSLPHAGLAGNSAAARVHWSFCRRSLRILSPDTTHKVITSFPVRTSDPCHPDLLPPDQNHLLW